MQIFEHENIKVSIDLKDIVYLNIYHSSHLAVKQINDHEVELKANSFVGKIVLPSKKEIVIKPKIKINNLLYMISYTYELVNFKNTENRKLNENDALIQIYIIVFLNWIENLFKKGLYKSYQDFTVELSGIKGKIKLNESLTKRNKLVCEFHDISFSNEENKIIKATLLFIINQKQIEEHIRQRALIFYRLLKEVSSVQLTKSSFKKININRLNNHYKPIIELCELIFNNLKLTDDRDKTLFTGYMVNMNNVFEKFLLKALQKKMKNEYVSGSSKNNWTDFASDDNLPQIKPDILVKNKAIIDAKYYKTPFTSKGNYISGNIYQIITYLKAYKLSKGFLVYPEPENLQVIDSSYQIDSMNFNIFSIPLNKEIQDMENALDYLVKRILTNELMN
jgi:5-methylcytosine-specific restriction enzyme subunit McrC